MLFRSNAVRIPDAVAARDAEIRSRLLNEYNLEIGAGLGPLAGKIWRIGIMGYSARAENIMLCLTALGSTLADVGASVHVGDAEGAAHQAYANLHASEAKQKQSAKRAA